MPIALQEALQLAALPATEAISTLQERKLVTPETVAEIARHSLDTAAGDAPKAQQLFALAEAVHQAAGVSPAIEPWLHYAAGRLAVLSGDLEGAEARLTTARAQWKSNGDSLAEARSGLGLTQILTIQGRFDAAETTIRATIAVLADLPPTDFDARLVLFAAQQNLATLLSYQERHSEALDVVERVRVSAEEMLDATADETAQLELRRVLGELGVDAAVYLGYLDRPEEAVESLRAAIEQLTQADAIYDRGRAHANLGHLYTRTGRFAEALREFDLAIQDILGSEEIADSDPARWQAADVLFLEQSVAYLSLNLLPEASADLDRAIALLAQSGKQYEWGQAIYYRAMIALHLGDIAGARRLLDQAAALFTELGNRYWLNRVQIVQVHAAEQSGQEETAYSILDPLLQQAIQPAQGAALTWDVSARCEAALLAVRRALRRGDSAAANALLDQASAWLEAAMPTEATSLYSHLTLRLLHARGLAARTAGDHSAARRFFQLAVEAIERQRAALPIEEFRTAFLSDKSVIYADLALALLDEPEPAADALEEAFAVIERARSRALLERLLAVVDETVVASRDAAAAERGASMRQQLTWLYNQLLGEHPDSRSTGRNISDQIRACEAVLQRIERRFEPWLAEAEPATLSALQAALDADEQAIIYYCAGAEWMAFVVASGKAHLVRRLCSATQLETALAELRFQLGRVEVGGGYAARHAPRLLRGVRGALQRLYDLLIAPLAPKLHAARLLIVPYGSLHLTPFHALWDRGCYLLERYEIRYAPSASVELLRRGRARSGAPTTLAAFALRDASIPQAEIEAKTAARHFPNAQVFIDAEACSDALRTAAAQCDVLHFATHGLFRPDNPFFSALKLADGWVDVHEVYRLPLRSQLVILSACESGAVQVQGGDEAIGLARGFLGAGAQSLVVSMWNVHDASAAQIMGDFYIQLIESDLTPSAALRAAQLLAIGAERHPYYWAPYTAIG